LQVTQPWKDELVDLALQVEAKLAEFQETQTTVVNLFTEKVAKESLEQVRGSVAKIDSVHNKLQDVHTQWYNKTNKIIKERKEQKRCTTTSGSGMSHK
jgi:chemotaxis regulatin CheY-phosphate phosphatase CheZ